MYFDDATKRYGSDLPMSFEVTCDYRDSRGKQYHESFTIDFDLLRGATYTEVHGLHDAAKSLKKIADILKKSPIARGPLEVVHEGRDDYRERRKEERQEQLRAFEELESRLVRKEPVSEDDAQAGQAAD
ncbi:hypothetical protein [Amycolatopsis japonica]|uniref:hypothetical protein n=1 Tax=Amycolatopsis japonica TaxID=208439 RepID=UPI003402BCE2